MVLRSRLLRTRKEPRYKLVVRFYSGNDIHQMVPLSSLMINLPVKFIRGKFEHFLGQLNNVYFKKRRNALQFSCFKNITFCTTILCQFEYFKFHLKIVNCSWIFDLAYVIGSASVVFRL